MQNFKHSEDRVAAQHYRRAIKAANAVGVAQDWRLATSHFLEAVRLGHPKASREVSILGIEAGGIPNFSTSMMSHVCESPAIVEMHDLVTPDECAWVIESASGQTRPAMVFDSRSGQARTELGRSNHAAQFDFDTLNFVMSVVRHRIAAAAGVPIVALESTQVLSYETGQAFDWHFDYLDPAVPGLARDISMRGQRIATCLVYLNDGYQGGETAFGEIGIEYRGRIGTGLMWANTYPDGGPDRRTVHAGLPPSSGRKWVLSQWIRERPQY